MIINLRGTHGSGKSTIVKSIMEMYPERTEDRTVSRKRPWGYFCKAEGKPELYVPGHYETPCGGCDTITVVEAAYDLIRANAEMGRYILYEGILAQHYALAKFLTLRAFPPLIVIALTTPLDECIANTQKRRAERGEQPLADVSTIRVEHRGVEVKLPKLKQYERIDVRRLDRDMAKTVILKELGWE